MFFIALRGTVSFWGNLKRVGRWASVTVAGHRQLRITGTTTVCGTGGVGSECSRNRYNAHRTHAGGGLFPACRQGARWLRR